MSLSRLRQLLCRGQQNIPKDGNKEVLLNNSPEDVGWSRYLVKLEVETVMRRRQLSSTRVLLKTSVTTVLSICLLFLIFYTIVLIFFTPVVPVEYNEWRARHRLKLIAKIKSGSESHKKTDQIAKSVMWNVSNSINIHLPEPRCEEKLVILILISSSVPHFQQRNAIRKSWCKTNKDKYAWKCIFLVGQPEESGNFIELIQKLQKEKENNRDILHGSYLDTYRNLTYKVMHGFSWATAHCPAKFLLKTDDDCFVNTRLIYDLALHHQDVNNLYIGTVSNDMEKRKVIRNVANRWHVVQSDYNEEYYPSYASGAGYLMSWDTVEKFVSISPYIKPIPVEDAYVGIMAQAKNIIPSNSGRFVLMSNGWTLCNYAYLVVIHNVKYHQQEELTHQSVQATEKCLGGRSQGEMYTWN